MRQLKTDSPTFNYKSSLITIGHSIPNGNKVALPVVNAAIRACKQYLANLKLIPANMSSGISVEYTLSPLYKCTIRFRFYTPCSLLDIDKHAEKLQKHLTALLKYYSNVMNADLKLQLMEKDLTLDMTTMKKTLGLTECALDLDHVHTVKLQSKAFGYKLL